MHVRRKLVEILERDGLHVKKEAVGLLGRRWFTCQERDGSYVRREMAHMLGERWFTC